MSEKVYKLKLTKKEICTFIDKIEDGVLVDKIMEAVEMQDSYISSYKNPNYFKEYYKKNRERYIAYQRWYKENVLKKGK